ncbi:MAG: peptidylprolyl isomerase [Sulfitobacter sp.]|jgi:peptidyl-prolyl cis-trans isomerase C|uniref:foldase protein PrsA n=1 Tax=Sulfitobacter sp. TaxID=1903071 RepID=UPI000C0E4F42|nr:peptidylprolyl isomerase [Roseobacter sp.]MBV49363.1 peptidylprolyl isomerase [Roseobacter sp.]PHR09433.1 MAG: peptidylprolyl isomerase [Sulfitobacter sp.]|tara:strand:+ start:69 stop:917 length:849 start_codon:yes stop_codon:yes gene_type:complete
MQKTLTFLAPFAIAASLALPVSAQEEVKADTVVATVNGTDITIGNMIIARATLPEQYQQLPPEVLFKGILDQLVQQTAISQAYKDDLPKRVTLALENERRQLIAGEVIEKSMAKEITPEELQAAYDETYANAEPTQEYNASHILVETEEDALAVKAEIEGGADFAEVAKEKSTGPSGPSGGSLGWFGPGMMVPAFETAVAELEVGDISAPVKTQFGWHIIKLEDKRSKEAPALEEVKAELETQVRQIKAQAMIEELTAAATVDRTAAEGIDPTVLTNIGLLE